MTSLDDLFKVSCCKDRIGFTSGANHIHKKPLLPNSKRKANAARDPGITLFITM